MWKWILGIVGFIIIALVVTCYAGYRKITSGGDTITAVIPAESGRTFALLTDHDSLLAWMPEGTTIAPTKRGPLQVGDTVRVAAPTTSNAPSGRSLQLWIIREVKPASVFAVEAIEFDPGGVPHTAFTRRDSLVAMGDSTQVVSTFSGAPIMIGGDSAAARGGATGSLLSAAEKMRVGASRMMWETYLQRLKRHATN